MTAAIYSRKSKFTGKGESVENQIEICREYIRRNYPECNRITVYEDEGFSGGNTDRPQFQQLMQDAEMGKVNAFFCYRLDRVSRNISDFTALIEKLNARQVAFISIKEQFDTSTPMGRAMMFIASVFSQLERETIAERIRDNMMELAKTGRWLGGVTPTGYDSCMLENGGKQGRVKKAAALTYDIEEIETIRLIFNRYLGKKSLAELETFLLNSGVQTKNHKAYSRFTIKNILENPVYAKADRAMLAYFREKGALIFQHESLFDGSRGIMAYNKTIQHKSRAHEKREIDGWIVAVGAHEGIIDGEDWVLVQHIIHMNRDKRYRRPRTNNALLPGILYCGCCGSPMRPKMHRGEGRERRFSYMCGLKEKSRKGLCAAANIQGNQLDCLVEEILKSLLEKEPDISSALRNQAASVRKPPKQDDSGFYKSSIERYQREINSLVNKIKWVEDAVVPEISGEIARLKDLMADACKKMAALDQENIATDMESFDIPALIARVEREYFTAFQKLDIVEKRILVKETIKSVHSRNEDLQIQLQGSGAVKEIVFPSGEYSK